MKLENFHNITIKIGDTIPKELLHQADEHEQIKGYVYPDDDNKFRVGMYYNNKLVGFMTPRKNEENKWRIGAIYVLPEYSRKGIAASAINQFLKGRKAAPVSIDVLNTSSQVSFSKAGYVKGEKIYQWSDGTGSYNIWTKD